MGRGEDLGKSIRPYLGLCLSQRIRKPSFLKINKISITGHVTCSVYIWRVGNNGFGLCLQFLILGVAMRGSGYGSICSTSGQAIQGIRLFYYLLGFLIGNMVTVKGSISWFSFSLIMTNKHTTVGIEQTLSFIYSVCDQYNHL